MKYITKFTVFIIIGLPLLLVIKAYGNEHLGRIIQTGTTAQLKLYLEGNNTVGIGTIDIWKHISTRLLDLNIAATEFKDPLHPRTKEDEVKLNTAISETRDMLSFIMPHLSKRQIAELKLRNYKDGPSKLFLQVGQFCRGNYLNLLQGETFAKTYVTHLAGKISFDMIDTRGASMEYIASSDNPKAISCMKIYLDGFLTRK